MLDLISLFDKYDTNNNYRRRLLDYEKNILKNQFIHFDESDKRIFTYHCLYCCLTSLYSDDIENYIPLVLRKIGHPLKPKYLNDPDVIFDQMEKTFCNVIIRFNMRFLQYDKSQNTVSEQIMINSMREIMDIRRLDNDLTELCLRLTRLICTEINKLKTCTWLIQRVDVMTIFDVTQRQMLMKYFKVKKFSSIALFVVLCHYCIDDTEPIYFNDYKMLTLNIGSKEDFKRCLENPLFEIFCTM